MTGELRRLHLALALLVLAVIMPVPALVYIATREGNHMTMTPMLGFFIVMLYIPALPLAIADSIWNLGKKQPATEFSSGYLWLRLLNIVGSIVSLYWVLASYPASLKAIRERYGSAGAMRGSEQLNQFLGRSLLMGLLPAEKALAKGRQPKKSTVTM